MTAPPYLFRKIALENNFVWNGQFATYNVFEKSLMQFSWTPLPHPMYEIKKNPWGESRVKKARHC